MAHLAHLILWCHLLSWSCVYAVAVAIPVLCCLVLSCPVLYTHIIANHLWSSNHERVSEMEFYISEAIIAWVKGVNVTMKQCPQGVLIL